MNIDTLEHDITKELYEAWKAKYMFWKPGIKTFYAPVIANPELMIISYQPGGNEKDFEKESLGLFEAGTFTTDRNDYVEGTYTMSKKVRSFFDFDPTYSILKSSVIVPLIFFRAPSIQVWNNDLSPNKKKEMEDLCLSKAKGIIDTVNPKKIFVIGIKTYQHLKELLPEINNEQVLYTRAEKGVKMAITAEYNGKEIFAMIHFTGAHINKTDWKTMKELFKNWFGK